MIKVDRLTFSYTKKPFIQDMSFSVSEGEIFGFLGPSGAGKSTLQKILLGMLPNYQGSAVVNGTECKKHHPDFYESIGVDFEFSTMYEKLSARENLCFFSSLYLSVTLSSNKLEGMAVTKLSSFVMFGAIMPFFVPSPIDLCVCFLPSYWMGKAVYEGKPIVMLLSVLVAVIWILIVKRKYDRKM